MDLLPGDLLLTRSEGLIGALIRFGERVKVHGWFEAIKRALLTLVHHGIPEEMTDITWVNHAAVYVGDGKIIEALANGLTENPVDKYAPGTYRIVRLADALPGVTDADRQHLVDFARFELARHDKYGWFSIFSIVVQLTTPVKLDVSFDGAIICSAFAAKCWEHAGMTLPTLSATTTMPSDLAAMAGTPAMTKEPVS